MSAAGRRRPGGTHLVVRTLSWPLLTGFLVTTVVPVGLWTDAPTSVPSRVDVAGAPLAGQVDLIRNREWPLAALHVPRAWKWSKGAGVIVAVLDTGVDGQHPDLTGRVIQGPDYTGRSRDPGSPYWGRHGTAMASIIAGHGHGPGRAAGVMGIAPAAKVLSIRVTWENNDPERTDSTQVSHTKDAVAKGIRYAADHGAQIINMSLGGGKMIYNGNPAEAEAVRYALGKGAVLIASAGNDGAGLNRRNYPAAYPGVTAVGAVDKTLRPAKFTNRHDYVSVAAPGVDIVSADAGRSYVQGTGTSPSAAIVAGIAALVRSHCPALTPEQTKRALEQGTTRRPPGGRNTKIGTGVTDAVQAIYAGHRICNSPSVSQPMRAEPQPVGVAARTDRVSLPLIAILASGGSLLVISLTMGWRQRARRRAETETRYPPYEISEPFPPPGPTGSSETSERHHDEEPIPASIGTASRVPVGAPVGGGAQVDESPWPSAGKPAESTQQKDEVPIPIPRPPAPPPRAYHDARDRSEHGFGDDPLGTGNIGPLPEISTPLADQSWQIVLRRGRRNGGPGGGIGLGDAEPPASSVSGRSAVAESSNDLPVNSLDFLPFESLDGPFSRPPEERR